MNKHGSDSSFSQSVKYGEKWIGRKVSDCSGMFVWAYRQHNKKIAHGSNSIWRNYLSDKGKLNNGKREDGNQLKPGSAVFKFDANPNKLYYHIGLYIGDGKVIEAQGSSTGVVQSSVTKWTNWGELRDVEYGTPASENKNRNDVVNLYTTKYVTSPDGKSVNVRKKPSTGSDRLVQLPVGSPVSAEETDSEWVQINVSYNGKTYSGYIMSRFLTDLQNPGTSEVEKPGSAIQLELDIEVAKSLANALKNAGISG